MRVRRLLAAVVTTGLIAPTAVVVASSTAPASAATATRVISAYSNQPAVYGTRRPLTAGDTISAGAYVYDATGNRATDGAVYLQRWLAGESRWSNVSKGGASYLFDSTKAVRNGSYRIYYTGSGTYSPSASQVFKFGVARKLTTKTIRGKQAGLKGRIKPAARVKVIVQKKVGKKYKKYKTTRTNRRGAYRIILPAPRNGRSHWKITFAGSKGYSKTVWKGYTYRGF